MLTVVKGNFASCQSLEMSQVCLTVSSAQFFGALTTIAYGGSAFFSYLDWRGDGGNAATSTVPT